MIMGYKTIRGTGPAALRRTGSRRPTPVLGGVTATVLRALTLPVLLAH
jgi:nucleotide-binding universal stress UspA family protein